MCLYPSEHTLESQTGVFLFSFTGFFYLSTVHTATNLDEISASSQENLSLGFMTRVDSKRPARLQKLARGLKFRI